MALVLPEFIGIGPAHAGTTWLHWVLKARVCLPLPKKETHFFDWHYANGIEWYAERFSHRIGNQPVGEICPYFPALIAIDRIALHIPKCKIICTLRDPIERAYSAYKFALYNGLTRDSFERALETAPSVTAGNNYVVNLSRWYDRFGKDRVVVVLFEDMCSRPQRFVDQVCEFIGVPSIEVASLNLPARAVNSHSLMPRNPRIARKGRRAINWLKDRRLDKVVDVLGHLGVWKLCFTGKFPPMASDTQARLQELYGPQVEVLAKLTGCDFSSWKNFHSSAACTPDLS